MNVKEFDAIIANQLKQSTDVLCNKAKEYATEDRLHNFKVAAELQGCSPRQALAGMMAKHTVSVYDLCMSEKMGTREIWDEKITDHINYLLLLCAVVKEELNEGTISLYSDGEQYMKIMEDQYPVRPLNLNGKTVIDC